MCKVLLGARDAIMVSLCLNGMNRFCLQCSKAWLKGRSCLIPSEISQQQQYSPPGMPSTLPLTCYGAPIELQHVTFSVLQREHTPEKQDSKSTALQRF